MNIRKDFKESLLRLSKSTIATMILMVTAVAAEPVKLKVA